MYNIITIFKQLYALPLCIIFFLHPLNQVFGQNYYYHNGDTVLLEPDYQRISISFDAQLDIKSIYPSTKKADDYKLSTIEISHTRKLVIPNNTIATQNYNLLENYVELKIEKEATPGSYLKEIKEINSRSGILSASPCFKFQGKRLGVSNNLYVKLKNSVDEPLIYEQAEMHNLEILGYNEFMPLWFTLSCGENTELNALQAANTLYETGLFESTEPEFIYHDLSATNDPIFPLQWGLENTGQNGWTNNIDINAPQAWAITTGSSNIKIAVFDHGIEINHPDLQGNIFGTGYNATTGTSPSAIYGSHGTACAGIISAVKDNNMGISGIAPSCKLMPISIRLLFSDTPLQLANGFNWAWQNGADVISNSWGGYAPSSIITDAISNALTNGRGGKGTVIVFAAGNENNTNIRYPGNSDPRILVVGAVSPCGERKSPTSCGGENWGSCYGNQLDVMAPGVKIPTTDRIGGNGYTLDDYVLNFNGTSSACPHIAGVAALILSVNPNLNVTAVNDIIEQSAQKIRTDIYNYTPTAGRPNGTWNLEMGYGLVNAYAALLLANTSCQTDVTITGSYNIPLTESTTWIKTSMQTVASATSTVKLDAASNSFIEMKPTLSSDYFLASPNNNSTTFLAQTLDGCNGSSPLKTSSTNENSNQASIGSLSSESLLDISETQNKTIHDRSNFIVKPNPTTGFVELMVAEQYIRGQYTITNINGQAVLQGLIASNRQELDLKNLATGVYIVSIHSLNHQYIDTKKLIKH